MIKVHQETVGFNIVELEPITIDVKKGSRDCNRGPLVSIYEGVVLGEAFEQGSGLFDDVPVMPTSRAGKSAFEGATVTDSPRPPEDCDEPVVSSDDFFCGRIKRHWASRRSSSG